MKRIIQIILVVFVVGVLVKVVPDFSFKRSTTISSTELAETLKDINELAVIEYNYSKVGKFDDSLKFNGWEIPLTQKSFIITYEGTLKAGIDLSDVKVSKSNKTITIKTDSAKILSDEIDEESIEVYDETSNIFNQIKIEDYKDFAVKQKKKVEEDAIKRGFLTKANDKVKSQLKKYVEAMPGIKGEYKVKVETK